jgi:hypothetical protein
MFLCGSLQEGARSVDRGCFAVGQAECRPGTSKTREEACQVGPTEVFYGVTRVSFIWRSGGLQTKLEEP